MGPTCGAPGTLGDRRLIRDVAVSPPRLGWKRAPWSPAAVMLALAAVCFAHLIMHPGALLVDGRRPSVDHANPGDARPIGNDMTFVFLPHHLWISKEIAAFGHLPRWDARGFAGRPFVGNPQAGLFYPPVWAVWRGPPSLLGWLTVGHLVWGGMGIYVLLRGGGRALGVYGSRRRLPGFAVAAGAHVRGPLPSRLVGLLVSLGVLGLRRGATGPRGAC